MRKSVSFLLVSMMLLTMLLSSCDALGGGGFKVGLVTDVGRINDRSFNQSAWDGVKAAAEDLGLKEGEDFKYIETKDAKDYHDNMLPSVLRWVTRPSRWPRSIPISTLSAWIRDSGRERWIT